MASHSPLRNRPQGVLSLLKSIGLIILDNWLVLGIGLACLLAWYFPSVAKSGGTIHSEYSVIYGVVSLIFLISGLSIPSSKLLIHLKNYRLHLIVQGLSFLVIPAIIFGIVCAASSAGIEPTVLVGMMVVGCIPTTISSNVILTKKAGGDDAAALVEVTIGNILGPFITPILVAKVFWPRMEQFDALLPASSPGELTGLYRDVFKQIGLTVLVPLFVGQLVQFIWPVKTKWTVETFYLGKVGTVCLTSLIWTTFSSSFATGALQNLPTSSLLFCIFVNLGLYMLFTIFCFLLARPPYFAKMPKTETVAVCFCGAAKTTALGIPLVTVMWRHFGEDVRANIQIPVVLYTTEQIFLAQVLVWWFKRWLREDRSTTGDLASPDASMGTPEIEEKHDVNAIVRS